MEAAWHRSAGGAGVLRKGCQHAVCRWQQGAVPTEKAEDLIGRGQSKEARRGAVRVLGPPELTGCPPGAR
eukprot:15330620-Heterocapsa_arctica.AAC.2